METGGEAKRTRAWREGCGLSLGMGVGSGRLEDRRLPKGEAAGAEL